MRLDLKNLSFQRIFKRHMRDMGAPVPDSFFKTVGIGLSTLGTISKFLDKYPKKNLKDLVTIITWGIGASTIAGMLAEFAVVAGAFVAALYVGVFVGCLITAAYEYSRLKPLQRRYYGFRINDLLDVAETIIPKHILHRTKIKSLLIEPDIRISLIQKGRIKYEIV